jgi:MoaA/NifB/PqqE/SkfB family radical SAM enzyme
MERAMYAVQGVSDDAEAFRAAVDSRTAYRPLYVKFKLFFGCNLRCEMCNHWRGHRESPLPAERVLQTLDELASLGCAKVHFSGGEPLLRPQVPEFIERASGRGIRVTMTTNGTLVDKALARRMIESGLRGVNVSIDAPTRRIHERVRGVEGSFKKTSRAVEYFRRYARKGKLTVRVNTVVSRLNFRALAGLPDYVADLGADRLNLIPVDDHCGEHLSLTRRHIREYNDRIAPAIAERALDLGLMEHAREAYPFGRTAEEISLGRNGEYAMGWYDRHPCFAPWTQSLIDFNGEVYVCCMTRERIPPLGDLRTSSFTEIWRGAAYDEVRGKMHPPRLDPCRRCDDYLAENRVLLQISSDRKRGPSPSRPTCSPP